MAKTEEKKVRKEFVFHEDEMFNYYGVSLYLVRRLLATNPADPAVHDTHIIKRQRNLILERSELNAKINKYLGALDISETKALAEREALLDKLEELTGVELTDKERQEALAGKLDKLKETFKDFQMSGLTVFFWNVDEDKPMIGSHMILGFMKASADAQCSFLKAKGESSQNQILGTASYTQKCINQMCSVVEEFITIDKDVKRKENGDSDFLQRSLRAETAKGPRVCLAKSEWIEKGFDVDFTLRVIKGSPIDNLDVLKKIFWYGRLKGIGQWRNADNGQFVVRSLEKTSAPEDEFAIPAKA